MAFLCCKIKREVPTATSFGELVVAKVIDVQLARIYNVTNDGRGLFDIFDDPLFNNLSHSVALHEWDVMHLLLKHELVSKQP